MTNVRTELDHAFQLLSSIPVTGDWVDIMAAARERLRAAYKLAEPSGKEGEGNG